MISSLAAVDSCFLVVVSPTGIRASAPIFSPQRRCPPHYRTGKAKFHCHCCQGCQWWIPRSLGCRIDAPHYHGRLCGQSPPPRFALCRRPCGCEDRGECRERLSRNYACKRQCQTAQSITEKQKQRKGDQSLCLHLFATNLPRQGFRAVQHKPTNTNKSNRRKKHLGTRIDTPLQ